MSMNYISNITQKLPNTYSQNIIKIDNKTRKLKTPIKGIKPTLFEHQEVLVQQLLDLIATGFIQLNDQRIYCKDLTISSQIGTGKSLISLALLQYFKNNNYENLRYQNVPVSQNYSVTIDMHDSYIKINPFQQQSLYYKNRSNSYYQTDILKENNYYSDKNKQQDQIVTVSYESFNKQALLFVQQQVEEQFINYINTQTDMTYTIINDAKSLFEYLYCLNTTNKNYEQLNQDKLDNETKLKQLQEKLLQQQLSVEEIGQLQKEVFELEYLLQNPVLTYDGGKYSDILIWNTDTVGNQIKSILSNLTSQLSQVYRGNNQKIIEMETFIKQFYNIYECQFNNFWIYHLDRLRQPFSFIMYDDFDIMVLPSCYHIPSLYNIFIGSTLLDQGYNESNKCKQFINDTFIHSITSLKIDSEQVNQMLGLPKKTYHKQICSIPSTIYSKFKILQYLQIQFDKIIKLQVPKISQQDFINIIMQETTFEELYKTYIKPYGLMSPQMEYNQVAVLDAIVCLMQEYRLSILQQNYAKTHEDKILKQIEIIKMQISQLCDGTLSARLEELSFDKHKILSQITQFQFDTTEIADNRIEDPFDEPEVIIQEGLPQEKMLEQQCCMTRCCNSLFNNHNINKIITLNNGNLYCVFCGKQVQNINIHVFDTKTQLYSQKVDYDKTGSLLSQEIVTPQSKLQHMYKILRDGFQQKKKLMLYIEEQPKIDFIKRIYTIDINQKFNSFEELVKITRFLRIYIYGDKRPNYSQLQRDLMTRLDVYNKYRQQIKQFVDPDNEADITICQNIKGIVGANLYYLHGIIFYNVPKKLDTVNQLIGRAYRIGQQNETDYHFLYYKNEKQHELQYD